MHFSSPSGHRFSWWWPWNRGAVGRLSSGYWTVSTFRNISWKVTPNPLIGLKKSLKALGIVVLPASSASSGWATPRTPRERRAVRPPRPLDPRKRGESLKVAAVIMRQVHRRHRECWLGRPLLVGELVTG